MINRFFTVLTISILFLTTLSSGVYADVSSNFTVCTSPTGAQLSNSQNGVHGVAGDQGTFPGVDIVYDSGNGNATQCLCANNRGVQTNWLSTDKLSQNEISGLIAQGWVYIPDGTLWGRANRPYLAFNLNYTCSDQPADTAIIQSSSVVAPSSSGSSSCTDIRPVTPSLNGISIQDKSVILTWNNTSQEKTTYLIAYGKQSQNYIYGNPNVGNAPSYKVNDLENNTTYYFAIKSINGCAVSDFSNELHITTNAGKQITSNNPITSVALTESKHNTRVSVSSVMGMQTTLLTNFLWLIIILLDLLIISIIDILYYKNNFKIIRWTNAFILMIIGDVVYYILAEAYKHPVENGISKFIYIFFWLILLISVLVESYFIRQIINIILLRLRHNR